MAHIDVQLDHAGYIVRNLKQQADRWTRLGFTLSPVSPQMGLNAQGEFEPWATANRCAVFATGYLELIGIHRPRCFNPWATRLAHFEGAHIIAFRVAHADSSYAQLANHSADFQPPVQRRRDAPFFENGAWGTREMGFRNIFSDDAAVPEARYIIIEHQSPEVLWQPVLTQHANGALGLESVSFVATDNQALEHRLALLADRQADSSRYACANGGIVEVLTPDAWHTRFPDARPLPASNTACIASCRIKVQSLDDLRVVLHSSHTDFGDDEQRIWVDGAHTGGAPFEFVE